MAKISKKIDEVKGTNAEAIKEEFSLLQKIAETKCKEFKTELEDMFRSGEIEQMQIVGKRAFKYYSSQHVDLTSECNDQITEAIDSFFEGKDGIKQGFQKLVNAAIQIFIGKSSVGESTEDAFWIYPENNAIVRVDVKMYKYSFVKDGFIKDCKNIFCYTMAKSIVDHTKLTKDELLYFITQMCKDEKGAVILQDVKAFVTELTDIWNLLESGTVKHQISENGILLDVKPVDEKIIESARTCKGALKFEDVVEYQKNGMLGTESLEHANPYNIPGVGSINTGRARQWRFSPDFLFPIRSSKINMTGYRRSDYLLAENGTPRNRGEVWHHRYDYDDYDDSCTMQLVSFWLHLRTIPHVGACKQWSEANGQTYRTTKNESKLVINNNVFIVNEEEIFGNSVQPNNGLNDSSDVLTGIKIGEFDINCNDDVIVGDIFDKWVAYGENENLYLWGYDVYGNNILVDKDKKLYLKDHESGEITTMGISEDDIFARYAV